MRDGEQPIARITGNTQDLKSNQTKRLKKISERRIRGDAVVTQDFARSLCELSFELNRQLGVLVDRQGYVRYLTVGDAQRIFIPELERNRSARLRGLRLIKTHLKREALSQEDFYDLTLLRLDYVTAITMDRKGLPEKFHNAYLQPGEDPGYHVEKPYAPGQLPENFTDTLRHVEELFEREEDRLRRASDLPRALLVGVYTPEMRRKRSPEDSLAELKELCLTAGVQPVDAIAQRRPKLDPVTLVGSGKAREISIQAVQKNAEMMIFDLELSPAQAQRLSAITDLKIIDRTQLILDIFARNARSRDGKLQVELAQLRYLKGRLSEKDDNMSRLTGGIGGRGPGETKLEIGRRRVNDRISRLEKELSSLKQRRELNRNRRNENRVPIVSIVGYTNAGKSTLLNALTNSEVTSEDRLFATLDPTTRRVRFPKEKEIVLSDTVGFIHDLPPELSRAFEATLEELFDSDLLLHVIDASDAPAQRDQKIEAVHGILARMELLGIPQLRVYNKSDCLSVEDRAVLEQRKDGLCVSALARENLEELLLAMEACVFGADVPPENSETSGGASASKKNGQGQPESSDCQPDAGVGTHDESAGSADASDGGRSVGSYSRAVG